MGVGKWLLGKTGDAARKRNLTPDSMNKAKSAWEVRYRANRRFGESAGAYQRRTGDKRPGGMLF